MKHLFSLLLIFTGLCCCTSCSDEAEQAYAHFPAFFRFTPVTAAHPLHAALNNPGEYCTISIEPRSFVFTDQRGRSVRLPQSAVDEQVKPEYIDGFVVGTPSTPDMSMRFVPLAFDRACPACYEYHMKQVSLQFDKARLNAMKCPRCHRVYDMSLQGAVVEGEPGPRMYWYRSLDYRNNTLIIRN